MANKVVSTSKAPGAIGPYSQAKIANGFLFVSGQLPIDPETGIMPESVEEQTARSMRNILGIIEAAGGSAKDIVRCGLYVRDMKKFCDINTVYAKFFEEEPPARFVVEVSALPKGASIEIEAIAAI